MQNSFFMQQAINEALKADPEKVYPNPMVGCVIPIPFKPSRLHLGAVLHSGQAASGVWL